MKIVLSIVIPTFNRPDKVVLRIAELIPQLNNGIELVVIDNGSDVCIEEYANERLPDVKNKVRFCRNSHNIGLGANVCRAFEYAVGEWIWILGDDDSARSDAVKIIIDAVTNTTSDVGFINFSTPFNSFNCEKSIFSEKELLNASSEKPEIKYYLSNLVFISVGCYRSSLFHQYWRTGYAMSSSHCPHFAMILAFLISHTGRIILSPAHILHWDESTSGLDWSRIKLMLGCSSLVEIENASNDTHKIVKRLLAELKYRHYLRKTVAMILGDLNRPVKFWLYFLTKMIVAANLNIKTKSILALLVLPVSAIHPLRCLTSNLISKCKNVDSTLGEERL